MFYKEEKDTEVNIKEAWDNDYINTEVKSKKVKKKMSFSLKLFIISFLVFILTVALFSLSFLFKTSDFSDEKILISVNSPVNITSGEENEIKFVISNENNNLIKDAYIDINYDSGEDSLGNKNIVNKRIEIGDININQSIIKVLDFTFFGSEGAVKNIKAIFYYKLPDSKAEFNKNIDITPLIIKTSPVSLNVKSLKQIHKDYNLDFVITVKNNTNANIDNLIVTVKNPNDFIFNSLSLPFVKDTNSWIISDLEANSKKDFAISGKLTGDIGAYSVFTFIAGVSNKETNNKFINVDNVYSKIERQINITGQYLTVDTFYDSSSPSYVLGANQMLTLEFIFKNNLSSPLENVSFVAEIDGDNIDIFNSYSQNGFIDKEKKIIIWDSNTMSGLARVAANGEGKLSLTLRTKRELNLNSKNIKISIKAKGDRNSEDSVSNDQDVALEKVWSISE